MPRLFVALGQLTTKIALVTTRIGCTHFLERGQLVVMISSDDDDWNLPPPGARPPAHAPPPPSSTSDAHDDTDMMAARRRALQEKRSHTQLAKKASSHTSDHNSLHDTTTSDTKQQLHGNSNDNTNNDNHVAAPVSKPPSVTRAVAESDLPSNLFDFDDHTDEAHRPILLTTAATAETTRRVSPPSHAGDAQTHATANLATPSSPQLHDVRTDTTAKFLSDDEEDTARLRLGLREGQQRCAEARARLQEFGEHVSQRRRALYARLPPLERQLREEQFRLDEAVSAAQARRQQAEEAHRHAVRLAREGAAAALRETYASALDAAHAAQRAAMAEELRWRARVCGGGDANSDPMSSSACVPRAITAATQHILHRLQQRWQMRVGDSSTTPTDQAQEEHDNLAAKSVNDKQDNNKHDDVLTQEIISEDSSWRHECRAMVRDEIAHAFARAVQSTLDLTHRDAQDRLATLRQLGESAAREEWQTLRAMHDTWLSVTMPQHMEERAQNEHDAVDAMWAAHREAYAQQSAAQQRAQAEARQEMADTAAALSADWQQHARAWAHTLRQRAQHTQSHATAASASAQTQLRAQWDSLQRAHTALRTRGHAVVKHAQVALHDALHPLLPVLTQMRSVVQSLHEREAALSQAQRRAQQCRASLAQTRLTRVRAWVRQTEEQCERVERVRRRCESLRDGPLRRADAVLQRHMQEETRWATRQQMRQDDLSRQWEQRRRQWREDVRRAQSAMESRFAAVVAALRTTWPTPSDPLLSSLDNTNDHVLREGATSLYEEETTAAVSATLTRLRGELAERTRAAVTERRAALAHGHVALVEQQKRIHEARVELRAAARRLDGDTAALREGAAAVRAVRWALWSASGRAAEERGRVAEARARQTVCGEGVCVCAAGVPTHVNAHTAVNVMNDHKRHRLRRGSRERRRRLPHVVLRELRALRDAAAEKAPALPWKNASLATNINCLDESRTPRPSGGARKSRDDAAAAAAHDTRFTGSTRSRVKEDTRDGQKPLRHAHRNKAGGCPVGHATYTDDDALGGRRSFSSPSRRPVGSAALTPTRWGWEEDVMGVNRELSARVRRTLVSPAQQKIRRAVDDGAMAATPRRRRHSAHTASPAALAGESVTPRSTRKDRAATRTSGGGSTSPLAETTTTTGSTGQTFLQLTEFSDLDELANSLRSA